MLQNELKYLFLVYLLITLYIFISSLPKNFLIIFFYLDNLLIKFQLIHNSEIIYLKIYQEMFSQEK